MEITWDKIKSIIDTLMVHQVYKLVKWFKPPHLFYKLNSDDSCIESMCGASGVIRDSNGHLIFAFSVFLGPGTSNWAEGRAMLQGLKHCAVMNLNKNYCRS